MRDLGVGVGVDDFGTGYSSLTHRRQFPVTTIKIDQGFMRNLVDQPEDLAIVTSVVELARSIGLRTVAEGVETQAQWTLLRRLGCELGQGNIFWSPARARDDLAALVSRQGFGAATLASRTHG